MAAVGMGPPEAVGWGNNNTIGAMDAASGTAGATGAMDATDAIGAISTADKGSPRRASIAESIKSVVAGGTRIRCGCMGGEPRARHVEARRADQREKIYHTLSALPYLSSAAAGAQQGNAIKLMALAIERLFKDARRLAALTPSAEAGGSSAVITVLEQEVRHFVEDISPAAFNALSKGSLSPRPSPADTASRDALLMRLHRCKDLPAQTVLLILKQAVQEVAWIFQAERELKWQTDSALEWRSACLRPEQDRERLQDTLCSVFMKLSEEQSGRLGGRVGAFFALARLPSGVWPLYQRSLPFAVVNEARQALEPLRMPAPVAIAAPEWRRFWQGWEHEYQRRVASLDDAIGALRKTTDLPDAQRGVRLRKISLGLHRLAALMRTGLAGADHRMPAAGETPDAARDGAIADRYASVAAAVQAAASKLGLGDSQAPAASQAMQSEHQASALGAMSDKEFSCVVSASAPDALGAFGLLINERALASERDRRVAALARKTLAPCLARLVDATPPPVSASALPQGITEDTLSMLDVGARLRDAADTLQAVASLYSACGGTLDGADVTAAFVARMVTLARPGLQVTPARARSLGRLGVALSDARADLAASSPGLAHGPAGSARSRENLLRAIADRLADPAPAVDAMDGVFFALIRRVSFAAMLAAFVSSASSTRAAGAAREAGNDALSDPAVRWTLQGHFGLEVDIHVQTGTASGAIVVRDAMGGRVEDQETGKSIAVREIYNEELTFEDAPIEAPAGPILAGEPGAYPVNASVVDELYAVDYERGSSSLAVRGRSPDGTLVSFEPGLPSAPTVQDGPAQEAWKRARADDVEQALACLSRMVNAQGFRQLTRLLSQFAAASIFRAEIRAGTATPLRLGTGAGPGAPVSVSGRAHTHALIEQNLDDTFDISVHVEWLDVNAAALIDPRSGLPADVVDLDPTRSAKAARYAWRVCPGNEPLIQPLQLADYRYCFVPVARERRDAP